MVTHIRHAIRIGTSFSIASLVLLSSLVATVRAAPPDAGSLGESTLPTPTLEAPLAPSIEVTEPEAASVPAPAGPAFRVERLLVTGSTIFAAEALHAIVADSEGKTLSLPELQASIDRITRHYRERGYLLARAYLPAQDVKDGVVKVMVLEGNLESVDSRGSARLPVGLRAALSSGLTPGAPLRTADVERAVLLHEALPGVSASARLRAGSEVGGTVLVLEAEPERQFEGELRLDNEGNRYTGEYQLGASLAWNNPGARGDRLAADVRTGGEGAQFGRLAYDAPLHGALRGSLALAHSEYELGREFAALDASGISDTRTLEATYPWILRTGLQVQGSAALEQMELEDSLGVVGTSEGKSLTHARLGLTVQRADTGGVTAGSLQWTSGEFELEDLAAQLIDATTTRADGDFHKISLSLQRLHKLPAGWQLRTGLQLQQALGNLASVQKLAIGGPNAVRAYPAGEASGDDVRQVTLELQHTLTLLPAPWRPEALVFADYGHAKLNHETWAGFTGTNERELSGAGFGLDWRGPARTLFSLRWARRLVDEPVTSEPDSADRLWLSASIALH